MPKSLFQTFKTNISGIALPEKFTFPFYYEPHPLAVIASRELQTYLQTQTNFEHNFGLEAAQSGLVIGKMFGVLVCQNKKGDLGYLWAFSGKLAEVNHLNFFVPTVYDMLHTSSFYKKEEDVINGINHEIEKLESEESYLQSLSTLENTKTEAEEDIQRHKKQIRMQKKVPKKQRIPV